MSTTSVLYIVTVLATGLIILALLRLLMRRVESQRREKVQDRDDFMAVATTSPLKRPLGKAREIALHSVATRFTVLRRFVTLLLLVILLVILSLPFLGQIPTAMISLLVGSTAVIVGIAAKPFIENLIAGVVITFSRPFHTGDTVLIDDKYGSVEDITMTHTIVKIWDWRRYVVPNAQMITKDFINLTLGDPFHWTYVEFWVSPDADLEIVREKAIAAAEQSDFFANYEPPRFWVMELGKEAIRCWVAAWANTPADAWSLKNEIRTELAGQLRKLGVTPHRFVLDIDGWKGTKKSG